MKRFSQIHDITLAGHGVGLRRPHFEDTDQFIGTVDFLEIVPENFMAFGGEPLAVLDRVRTTHPIIPHGVNLSVGGDMELDSQYLADLKALCDRIDAPFFSDHCCYTALGGAWFHDLLPMPFTEEAVAHIASRARQAAERVERPLVLENISYYAVMPGSTMEEAAFLSAILEEADCGLLLDVNNIVVNSHNHGEDPEAFLDAIPLERIVQVHMAGHSELNQPSIRFDDHGSAISDEVLALYKSLIRRVGAIPTLMEWDNNIPAVEVLIAETQKTRTAEAEALRTAEGA
jgi:uncharacterized protein (UPF0276 family)